MVTRLFRVWGKMGLRRDSAQPIALGGRVAEVWLAPEGKRRLVRIGARGAVPSGAPERPHTSQNIHAPGYFDEVLQTLAAGDGATFWIGRPLGVVNQSTVVLSGLHAIDQFEDGAQTLRWPLVPEGSHLELLREEDANYRFALGLKVALPVPLRADATGAEIPALDLSLTYETALGDDPLVPVKARYGRWTGTLPNTRLKLGSFGFASRTLTTTACRRMLNYKANGGADLKNGRLRPDLAGALASCGLGQGSTNKGKTAQIDLHAERQVGKPGNVWRYHILCANEVTLNLGGLVTQPATGQHGNRRAIRLEALDCSLALRETVTAEADCDLILDDARLTEALNQDPAPLVASVRLRLRGGSQMHVQTPNPTASDYEDGIPADLAPIKHGGTGGDAERVLLTGGGLAEAARLQTLGLQGLMTLASHPQTILGRMGFAQSRRSGASQAAGVVNVPVLIFVHGLPERPLGGGGAIAPAPGQPLTLRVTLDAPPADGAGAVSARRHDFDAWRSEPPKPQDSVAIRLSLPQLNNAEWDPRAGHKHRHIQAVYDPAASEPKGDAAILIRLHSDPVLEVPANGHLREFRGRLGALAFDGVGATGGGVAPLLDDANPAGNRLQLAPRHRAPMDQRGTNAGQPPLRLDLRYCFRLSRVAPVTTDIAHGLRRDGADDLVVNDVQRDADDVQRFILEVSETLHDRHDRHLTANLIDTARTTAGSEVTDEPTTVIAAQPFAVWRFARRPLEASGDAESSVVASYDSDRRSWEFRASTDTYRLTLPPGVTGETTDKPGRLEIHDAAADDDPLPAEAPQDGVARVRLVEMRLAPPTDLWFTAADLGRNFLRPELAAADLLVQRNDFGPGVALRGLRGELHYGLAFGLQVPAEGQGPQLRMAELAALVGRPHRPGLADGHPLAQRVTNALAAIARRPSRIEGITVDPRAVVPFRPAVFEQGLGLALRRTALIAPPLAGEQTRAAGPRLHPTAGLAGGALWPVEQRAILRLLLDAPVADGGRIEGFALSPHGASGDQEAVFQNGAIRIVSETRGGFVQRQRVEVLGRIAVFWHRARHVVVYERTTAPSAQFAPEHGGATRSARPILRKVEEYVDILEPVRRYPDLDIAPGDEAAIRAPGFLREVRFGARRIAVDSAWGRELGTWGWEVQLWNRGAAARRPQVYPEPDVALVAEGGDGAAPVAQACLDVDNLFFVTDAEAIEVGRGTDDWAARPGIDHSALGAPDLIEHHAEAALVGQPEGRRTALPRVLPGVARFTWRVAPTARGVQVNAGRGARPILAGLESVTMMRGAPSAVGLSDAERDALKDRLAPRNDPAAAHPPWLVTTAGDDPLGVIGERLRAVRDADDAGRPGALDALHAALADRDWQEAIRERARQVLGSDTLGGFDMGPNLTALIEADRTTCQRLARQATAGIGRKRMLIRHVLDSVEAELTRAADNVDADVLMARARNRIKGALTGLMTQADPFGPLDDAAIRAQAVLADWRVDALGQLDRARDRLAAARAAYERGRAASGARLWTALAALTAELDRVQDEALAAWTEAEIRFGSGLDGAAASLVARLARTMRHALKAGEGAFETFDARLGRALPGDASARIDAVIAAVADWLADNPGNPAGVAARDALMAVREATERLDGLRNQVKAGLKTGGAALEAIETDVTAALGALRDTLDEVLLAQPVVAELETYLGEAGGWLDTVAAALSDFDAKLDTAALTGFDWLNRQRATIEAGATATLDTLASWLKRADETLESARTAVDAQLTRFADGLVEAALAPIAALLPDATPEARIAAVQGLVARAERVLDEGLGALEGGLQAALNDGCAALVGLRDRLIEAGTAYATAFAAQAQDMAQRFLDAWVPGGGSDPGAALSEAMAFARRLEQAVQDVEAARDHARVYTDRVFREAAGVLSGGAGAVPGRLLRLHAAASQSPELAALKVKADRLRLVYRDLGERIDTSAVNAAFDRLGDALRSLGLDLRFDGLRGTLDFGDQMKDWDLRRMLASVAGTDVSRMLKGARLPDRLRDLVRISHDIDAKAGRAWVQIDLDIPLAGRQTLFTMGPFAMHLRDTRITARVRLEADRDSDRITTTDTARIDTSIEAVVGGTQIVTLERTVIRFSSAEKLSVRVDPKGIRLNAALRFVQGTLGGIFPEDIGGVATLKENGVPVGFEHVFALPPMSLMFGTSGISNLALENAFALRAYPDFVVSNRFALSKRELPFLFSFFIIGGTGFVRIEAEYRPLDGKLGVLVEVGIGGSAALGFSFGPVSGSVFITLSVVLTYRQGLGAGDRGLTISVVLVIAGSVRLFGMATVYLGLMLTLSYHESGRIDAVGMLSVELRISRFIKLRFRTRITYKLRDGKATRQIEHNQQLGGDALRKAMDLEKARRTL